jgi:hypothetical protein
MKNYLVWLFLGFTVLITSCKNDKSVEQGSDAGTIESQDLNGNPAKELLDPCLLISIEEIGGIFSVDPKIIQVKNDQFSGDFSKSCNIKWDDSAKGVTYSMLLILQSNPIIGEIDDWASSYIGSRINTGEKSFPDNGATIKYKKFEGIQSESAFDSESNKLYWKINKDYVFAVFLSDSFKTDKIKEQLKGLHDKLTQTALEKLK